MARSDGRNNSQIRPIKVSRNFIKYPEGSVLIESGDTRVICTASIDEGVPHFLKGSGTGWITAEYSMLPRATHTRNTREVSRPKGRNQEIQRLIGRSLRSVIDMSVIGERTIYIDADVIQADGGTRCASINGSFIALYDALNKLVNDGKIISNPISEFIAAISIGIVGGQTLLDLDYSEDSTAEIDMNLVMTQSGNIIEIQGTGERGQFSRKDLDKMLDLAKTGIDQIIKAQKEMLKK